MRDPVCGREVDPLRARAVAIWNGRTYYFCSAEHREAFRGDAASRGERSGATPATQQAGARGPGDAEAVPVAVTTGRSGRAAVSADAATQQGLAAASRPDEAVAARPPSTSPRGPGVEAPSGAGDLSVPPRPTNGGGPHPAGAPSALSDPTGTPRPIVGDDSGRALLPARNGFGRVVAVALVVVVLVVVAALVTHR